MTEEMEMKRMKTMVVLALLSMSSIALAQTAKKQAPAAGAPQSISTILDGQLKQIESELVPAVEAMPDDKFDFAPTNGEFKTVRTFALQARHVATTNYWLYGLMSGQKNPVELGKDENG